MIPNTPEYTPEELKLLKDMCDSVVDRDHFVLLPSYFHDMKELTHSELVRVARKLAGYSFFDGEYRRLEKVLFETPLTDVPLHTFEENYVSRAVVARWRLAIGK